MVDASMMSEEEMGDGKFKQKRPSWRSEQFNELIDILDERATGTIKQARKERLLCSPVKLSPPKNVQPWMIHETNSENVT